MMYFPSPFIVGTVVGSVLTYIYKDHSSKQWLSDTGGKLKSATGSFVESFKTTPEEEATTEEVDAVKT